MESIRVTGRNEVRVTNDEACWTTMIRSGSLGGRCLGRFLRWEGRPLCTYHRLSCADRLLCDKVDHQFGRCFSDQAQYHRHHQGKLTLSDAADDDAREVSSSLLLSRWWDGLTPSTRQLAQDLSCSTSRSDSTVSSSDGRPTRQAADPGWKRRKALSQATTLMESRAPHHQEQAVLLLGYLLRKNQLLRIDPSRLADDCSQHNNIIDSFRIGIAGPPGAGKSSFIETLGQYILDRSEEHDLATETTRTTSTTTTMSEEASSSSSAPSDWRPDHVAVVCIDPSSHRTGGSILGDKTRMNTLARHPRAWVRPAPAAGTLGGLAPYTADVLLLIAATGQYPVILLETVGLGQSELEVEQAVDMLLLLVPPAGGDDLQGVKKGILEVTDLVVVTKADGHLLPAARTTAADYQSAMRLLHSVRQSWQGTSSSSSTIPRTAAAVEKSEGATPVLLASAVTGEGLAAVWHSIAQFRDQVRSSGRLEERRRQQQHYWMWKSFQSLVQEEMRQNADLQQWAHSLEHQLDQGLLAPRAAAMELWRGLQSHRTSGRLSPDAAPPPVVTTARNEARSERTM